MVPGTLSEVYYATVGSMAARAAREGRAAMSVALTLLVSCAARGNTSAVVDTSPLATSTERDAPRNAIAFAFGAFTTGGRQAVVFDSPFESFPGPRVKFDTVPFEGARLDASINDHATSCSLCPSW